MSVPVLSAVSDFWHRYDDSVPHERPELKAFQMVWIHDELLGPVPAYWSGNGFRLYDKAQVPCKVTHWAYMTFPPPPPAEIEQRAS